MTETDKQTKRTKHEKQTDVSGKYEKQRRKGGGGREGGNKNSILEQTALSNPRINKVEREERDRERERDRDRDRDRERERLRQRETGRQADRQTDRHTQTQREKQKEYFRATSSFEPQNKQGGPETTARTELNI